MLPPRFQPTNEVLRLIAPIDEFKGEWRVVENIQPERLTSLRRVATIESIGSSTRIEGAKLSDREVETLLGNLQTESFRSRDEEEVAGYAYVMETIHSSWKEMPVTEGIVLQLHRDLLRYSSKDERHRGELKTLPNHVVAVGPDGKQIGIVFETAAPFDTPRLMRELFDWLAKEEQEPVLHPLLRRLQRGVPRHSSFPGWKWKTIPGAHQSPAAPRRLWLCFMQLAGERNRTQQGSILPRTAKNADDLG